MTSLQRNSWFLTPAGWRTAEDPVAVWDAEVWPVDTLAAGVCEMDEAGGFVGWQEVWRDRWRTDELGQAITHFGQVPPVMVPAAA